MRSGRIAVAALAGALAGGACLAQVERHVEAVAERHRALAGVAGPGGPDVTFEFMSSEMVFEGRPVKGAPYSADAVTETTQALADGNRISRKNTASIYRDSEGRTRREHSLPAIGPWASSGEAPMTISITDPVAALSYMLDPRTKTARKMAAGHGIAQAKEAGAAEVGAVAVHERAMTIRRHPGGEGREVVAFRAEGAAARARAPQERRESLGKQSIEGVQAEGTRTTLTIPAGDVGNERPIEIISERWYSPELQTVVMSRRNDPRMGEALYKLTNIRRTEPLRSLFEVPPDYTVTEGATFERRIMKPRDARE